MNINVIELSKGSRICHVNAHIETNNITALIGENGAGKTTLLQLIASLLKPTSGRIEFEGVTKKDIRSYIGFLPQFPSFHDWMTGLEYLTHVGQLVGMKKQHAVRKATDLLTLVRLEDGKEKRIESYSGGMKQRLGIAQSLVNDPKVLLLDEPVSALDPKARTEVMELLLTLKKERTIIYSTHVLHDAEQISDAYMFMHKGQLVETGSLHSKGEEYVLEIETAECERLEAELKAVYPTWCITRRVNYVEIRITPNQTRYDLMLLSILEKGSYSFDGIKKRKKTLEDIFRKAVTI
ncbi:ABC transporter ATP-binding protein [Shouchella miscanthi]|uniref:ABC transporter ATP-binding protein n=1 Tax=Shouchella miscanthi TaxID=2598861 RepID=UPI0011AA2206|nr:ABC transporter ATP-binding protein [Shouchella miscanthi]